MMGKGRRPAMTPRPIQRAHSALHGVDKARTPAPVNASVWLSTTHDPWGQLRSLPLVFEFPCHRDRVIDCGVLSSVAEFVFATHQ